MANFWYPAPAGTLEVCIAFRDSKPFVRRSPVTLLCRTTEGLIDWQAPVARPEIDETEDSFTVLLLPWGDVLTADNETLPWPEWLERVMESYAAHVIEHYKRQINV